MSRAGTPILDQRDAARVLAELLARRPAYLPDWLPAPGQAGWALLQVLSRYAEIVIDRLNQAPDRNKLAFLDMLGISLIPAQPARAPVVFEPLPNAGDGRIPAGTRLGAEVADRSDPLTFETESAIAMAAAQLVAVRTLWPAYDEYADHSLDLAGRRPFPLFSRRQSVPHEIYLAHDRLLAFAGKTTVQIQVDLATPGSEPLKIAWEYWDGQTWRPFKPFDADDEQASRDGTNGLTRSGVITLRAECGDAKKTTVHGIEAYWMRGRLEQALPPDTTRALAQLDRLHLRCDVDRPGSWSVSQEESDVSDGMEIRVRYKNGAPIQGLRVDIWLGNEGDAIELSTDEAGTCRLDAEVVFPGSHRIALRPQELPDIWLTAEVSDAPVRLDFVLTPGVQPERAFADGVKLDLSKSFYPLGQHPQPGSAFYFSTEEIFSKPGATMHVILDGRFRRAKGLDTDTNVTEDYLPTPDLAWEYSNGKEWLPLHLELPTPLPNENDAPLHAALFTAGELQFEIAVPLDMSPVTVNGEEALWMRVRLVKGQYGYLRTLDTGNGQVSFEEIVPPVVSIFRLGYIYRSPWELPTHCITHNDFQFQVHSRDLRWPGRFFAPFEPVADRSPTLYLGFDRPLPNDLISLYLDLAESETEMPPLVWEARDGTRWRELRVHDETKHLARPGMLSFLAPDVAPRPQATFRRAADSEIVMANALEAAVFQPGQQVTVKKDDDTELGTVEEVAGEKIRLQAPLTGSYRGGTVELAALPRFGVALDWVRGRMKSDGAPPRSTVSGIHVNATWAQQVQTLSNEVLGSGTGQPKESFFFRQVPVLPGEQVEVRELDGARAEVELPMLRNALRRQGLPEDAVRAVTDPRGGRVREVWVRWEPREHLFFSGPDDRHYVIERGRGRLIFGDGVNGLVPPPGANNIRASRYCSGGGVAGNVAAGAISQLLSGALFVQSVTNPRAADGGADGEDLDRVFARGPQMLRHRRRALSAQDYEWLAREASPGVAAARALPATAPNGRPAPGWVTLIIVPQSQAPEPQPSLELRDRVHVHLLARAPATIDAHRLAVIGPTYLPIGVSALVVPRTMGESGAVESAVLAALARFLHPLTGGPEGRGWPFGRAVYLSDVAALLEGLDGVDHVEDLNLLLNETPRGERVVVPPDRIVVAGPLRVEMKTPSPA